MFQKLAHHFQRRRPVPPTPDQHVEHFALGVDGPPELDHAAVDPEIDLVQVPVRMRLWRSFAQVGRDPRPKMDSPAPDGLIGDDNPALGQQILDVAEAQRETIIIQTACWMISGGKR